MTSAVVAMRGILRYCSDSLIMSRSHFLVLDNPNNYSLLILMT